MRVIGFLTWREFVEELEKGPPPIVRITVYHMSRGGKDVPPVVEFFAEAGFARGEELFLARFLLGREIEFVLRDNSDKADEFARRMEDAREILHTALTRLGAEVRPGLFVKETPSFLTSPEGLWRWQKDGDSWCLVSDLQEEVAG